VAFENWAAIGICLGIAGGLPTVGTDAVIWNCNTNPDQQWNYNNSTVGPNGEIYYQFRSNDNNLCLGVAGGSTTEGAHVVGWTCLGTNHPDQYWAIENGPNPCSSLGGGIILRNLKDGYVIGTQGGSLKEGTPLVQRNYQNACNNQIWLGPSA
jgi:hypothetical protein